MVIGGLSGMYHMVIDGQQKTGSASSLHDKPFQKWLFEVARKSPVRGF